MIKLFKLRDDKFFLIRSHVRRLMGGGDFFFFFSVPRCTRFFSFFQKIYAHLFMRAYLWLQLAYISWLMYPDLLISSVFARTSIFFFFCFFSEKFQRYIFVLKRGWNNIIICSIYRFHNYNYNMLALVVIVKIDFLRLLRR